MTGVKPVRMSDEQHDSSWSSTGRFLCQKSVIFTDSEGRADRLVKSGYVYCVSRDRLDGRHTSYAIRLGHRGRQILTENRRAKVTEGQVRWV